MTKAIIFDLDMCILDTHSLTGPFFEPVLTPLRESSLPDELKQRIENELWTTSLDDTVAMFSIPDDVVEKMRAAYQQIEVPDGIRSFGDESYLRDIPATKILVTTGYRRFQETKIEKLGIEDLFESIIIDALDNRFERKGKKRIFEELLSAHGWQPEEVLVVGDNPHSELAAAQSLGIPTVQTVRPTITPWAGATYHIHSFSELKALEPISH